MSSAVSESQKPWILQERAIRLSKLEERVKGYRPDMQALIRGAQPHTPLRPAILDVLASLYKRMEENGKKEQINRDSTVVPLYSDVKERIIRYVRVKKESNDTIKNVAKINLWASEVAKTEDTEKQKILLKASDHLEDALFLAELTIDCKIGPDLAKVEDELNELVTAVASHYLSLLSSADSELRERLVPALNEVSQLYRESKFEEALQRIHVISALIQPLRYQAPEK